MQQKHPCKNKRRLVSKGRNTLLISEISIDAVNEFNLHKWIFVANEQLYS